MRFKAFRVSKSHSSKEQNFIFYVKDLRVLYDKLSVSIDSDIDSESVFKVYETSGTESLRKLKAHETFKRVLKLREKISMPEGSFQNFIEKVESEKKPEESSLKK